MFESINPVLLNGVGVVGLCVFIVLAFILGWIVSKREHDDLKEDRNHWRGIAESSQERLNKLLVMSELGIYSIREIEKKSREGDGGT